MPTRTAPPPAPTAAPAPAIGSSFAFGQGIPRDGVLRLLSGRFTKADYGLYLTTPHWRAVKAETMEKFGHSCALCGSPLALQCHHKPHAYHRLFRERPIVDVVCVCSRCHRRHHGK